MTIKNCLRSLKIPNLVLVFYYKNSDERKEKYFLVFYFVFYEQNIIFNIGRVQNSFTII